MNIEAITASSSREKTPAASGPNLSSTGSMSLIRRKMFSAFVFLAAFCILAWGAMKLAGFLIPHPSDHGKSENARRYTASGEYEYFGRAQIEPNRVVVIRTGSSGNRAPAVDSDDKTLQPSIAAVQSQTEHSESGAQVLLKTEEDSSGNKENKDNVNNGEGVVLPDGTFIPDTMKRKEETKPVFEVLPPELAAEIAGEKIPDSSLAAPSSGKELKAREEEAGKIAVDVTQAEKDENRLRRDEALSSPMMGMLIKGEKKKGRSGKEGDRREYAESDNNLNEKLMPVKIEAGSAARIRNRHLTLAKGTFINCILETKVDTTVPGMTSCRIPENLYSMDGSTVLIEAGSRMFGEYRGALSQGQDRVFVLWTQVRTPYGVVVDLDSPGTDPLGGAGHAGEADFHWWQRFGNALLFSLIDDSFNFATMKAGERSDGVSYYTTSQNPIGELITEAMKQSGQIPPTIRINQGARIGIFTARNIDMSSVYELKPWP